MSRRRRFTAVGFGVLAATDTALAGRGDRRARQLRRVTKPLLMPALAASFATSTAGRRDVLRQATLVAQAFSWGGDVALLGRSERTFLAGLGSFFIAHLGYITGFASRAGGTHSPNLRGGVRAAAVLSLTAAPAMAVAAGRKDPALRLPVGVYASALATMFGTSTTLDPALPRAGRRKVVLGTTLFLVSDTLLGLREFWLDGDSTGHDVLGSAVMATYTSGQWLVADGVRSL